MFHDKYDNNHIAHNSATTYVTGHKNTTSTKNMGTNINQYCIATSKSSPWMVACTYKIQRIMKNPDHKDHIKAQKDIESLPLHRILTNWGCDWLMSWSGFSLGE